MRVNLANAAKYGELSNVKQLLAEGTDVNTVDANQTTALYHSVDYCHVEIVCLLLDAGADVTIRNRWGHSVFDALDYRRLVGDDEYEVAQIEELLKEKRPEEFMAWWMERDNCGGCDIPNGN